MSFSNFILILTFLLSCVHAISCAEPTVAIIYKCNSSSANTSKCFTQDTTIYCNNHEFGDPAVGCVKDCYLGSVRIGGEGQVVYVGLSCSNRVVDSNPLHAPCAENTCYAQIAANGSLLQTCGTSCPDNKLTQPNNQTGKCEMKPCTSRKPNLEVKERCGTQPCYQQINAGTGSLKDACGETCPEANLTVNNLVDYYCQMQGCLARIPSNSVSKPCGNGCYQQITTANGALEEKCLSSCPDPSLTVANNTNGKCDLKDCGLRVPTNASTMACGPACYKQIDSATGKAEESCMNLCPDQRLTQLNPSVGKCEMKPCTSRTPNPDVTPVCGPQCDLREDGTCTPAIVVEEDGEGEGDEGTLSEGNKAQMGDDGSSLTNVYLALAILLPVMGVVALISGISCIVMIVMQAKIESKAKRVDIADDEKDVVEQVIQYIEAAAEDASLAPALARPAPSVPRKSVRKSARKSVSEAKLQDEK